MSQQKKSKMLNRLGKCMQTKYGRERADRLMAAARQRFTQLCLEHGDYPQALHRHTERNMFPTMAIFDALVADGCSRQEAAQETNASKIFA